MGEKNQGSDWYFLLYTITTNVTEKFIRVWHREAADFEVRKKLKSPKIVQKKIKEQWAKSQRKKHCTFLHQSIKVVRWVMNTKLWRKRSDKPSYELSVGLSVFV